MGRGIFTAVLELGLHLRRHDLFIPSLLPCAKPSLSSLYSPEDTISPSHHSYLVQSRLSLVSIPRSTSFCYGLITRHKARLRPIEFESRQFGTENVLLYRNPSLHRAEEQRYNGHRH
jgi:hypothetical protein